MFKKAVLFSLAVVWLLAGVVGMASAAQNVGNTSQKGSLLIFPKIEVGAGKDTLISISNDYFKGVPVKCYWVSEQQEIRDFQFLITVSQPIWFRASDGLGTASSLDDGVTTKPMTVPPFFGEGDRTILTKGELKCWAVNFEGRRQINWNHLTGTAMVLDYTGQAAYQYNSFNFSARGFKANTIGQNVGTLGKLPLTGLDKQYDACPQYLMFNFFAHDKDDNIDNWRVNLDDGQAQIKFNKTDLTMAPCKQDLRQDRIPTCSKAQFVVYNENEVQFTGAYQCFKCFYDHYLDEIDVGAGYFTVQNLHTLMGRFTVQGVPSTKCTFTDSKCQTTNGVPGVYTPLLGVTTTEMDFLTPAGKPELLGATGVGAGTWKNPEIPDDVVTIQWDPLPPVQESPEK